MTPLLRLTAVSKSFAGVHALRDVSFDVAAGEVHALVGENGAGKSTLVRIATGAHRPDAGTIEVEGRPLDRADPLLSRELGIAPIYQQPALFPDLTVTENLAFGIEPGGAWRRLDWRARRRRAEELLARVGASVEVEARAGSLRMAEQQLVEIARALGAKARVLLMDEPTAALAETEAERLFELVGELRASGVGIVYISHRLAEVARVANRVTVLRDGMVVATRPMADVTEAEVIRLMVGRELTAVFPKREVPHGAVALEARGLGSTDAGVSDASFAVHAGEILGVAGLVGSGRTELARVLFGLEPADAGELLLQGSPVRVPSPPVAVRLGLAYVPEDRRRHGVVPEMSVVENTTLAVLPRMAAGFFLDSERERALTAGFVARFAIRARSPDAAVATLSGGNQQKVALARWLATDPVVLILDEPTQGVDVGAKAEIHKLMGDLAEQGIAIVMISSELPEILGMSDRIAIMRGGTIVATVDRAGATPEAVLALALGHETAVGAPAADRPPPFQRPVSRRPAVQRSLARHRREASVGLALAGLLVFLAWRAPGFFAIPNLRDLFVSSAPVLVAAVGMALVILSRQIDISIGSQFAIGGVAAGLLAKTGLPMPFVAVGSLGVGALLGALNGALVVGLGLPSIVATLATMVFLREMLRWATEGVWVQDLPAGFQWFGLGQEPGRAAVVLAALAIYALFAWGLRHLAAGRAVYATGSEPEVARLVGIRPGRVVFGVFVVMGATTGLAALLTSIQFIDVQTNAGVGLEMKVIAAVVVGGTAITGGRGTLMGTLLGVALLGVIGPALTFLGTEAHWERALQGLVILLAVTADALESRKGDADR